MKTPKKTVPRGGAEALRGKTGKGVVKESLSTAENSSVVGGAAKGGRSATSKKGHSQVQLGNEALKRKGKRKGVPRKIGAAEKMLLAQAEAVRLRSEEHLPYRAIAKELGVGVKTAYMYVQAGLADLREEIEKNGFEIWRERLHSVELLQGLIAKWYPVATAPAILRERMEDGTLVLTEEVDAGISASATVINATKEIAKILGLNAAVKVTGNVNHNHREAVPMAELAARAGKLRSRDDLIAALLPAYGGTRAEAQRRGEGGN